eukprot:tig00020554_g10881.t1
MRIWTVALDPDPAEALGTRLEGPHRPSAPADGPRPVPPPRPQPPQRASPPPDPPRAAPAPAATSRYVSSSGEEGGPPGARPAPAIAPQAAAAAHLCAALSQGARGVKQELAIGAGRQVAAQKERPGPAQSPRHAPAEGAPEALLPAPLKQEPGGRPGPPEGGLLGPGPAPPPRPAPGPFSRGQGYHPYIVAAPPPSTTSRLPRRTRRPPPTRSWAPAAPFGPRPCSTATHPRAPPGPFWPWNPQS